MRRKNENIPDVFGAYCRGTGSQSLSGGDGKLDGQQSARPSFSDRAFEKYDVRSFGHNPDLPGISRPLLAPGLNGMRQGIGNGH